MSWAKVNKALERSLDRVGNIRAGLLMSARVFLSATVFGLPLLAAGCDSYHGPAAPSGPPVSQVEWNGGAFDFFFRTYGY